MSTAPEVTASPTARTAATSIAAIRPGRIVAIDALRGFDMFWLAGGQQIVRALPAGEPGGWVGVLQGQFEHATWAGFTFYDLIFPLFLFLIGCSIPFALRRRRERSESNASIYRHIALRVALMVVIGMTINGNLLTFDRSKFQLSYSVLQMLAYGYAVAAILYLNFSLRIRLWWCALSLVLYWALETFVPVPGHEIGVYAAGRNFGDWFNAIVLGDLRGPWQIGWIVEGALAHSATAMLGVFAGEMLQAESTPARRLRWFAILGLGGLLAGWLWSLQYPIVKTRWTSSYVLFAGGWSFLLLALFYWATDLRGWRRWAFPFVVIGSNSIVAYVIACHFMPSFQHVSNRLLGGLGRHLDAFGPVLVAMGSAVVVWVFLYWLYRTKVFVRL
ncbi:MAG: DUF5009 domain-containing protein [Opitutaceae bacterium]|nr:DUF5009 domain-containing protein [Opitutaceae bacterium]